MKRTHRLQPAHELAEENERQGAVRLADAQTRIEDAERRCEMLDKYHQEYQQRFKALARNGLDVQALRVHHAFTAKLVAAIDAQRGVIARLLLEGEASEACWREATTRRKAIGKVVERAHADEVQVEERRLQREIDDRAPRRENGR